MRLNGLLGNGVLRQTCDTLRQIPDIWGAEATSHARRANRRRIVTFSIHNVKEQARLAWMRAAL
jgi:hypothetical protein